MKLTTVKFVPFYLATATTLLNTILTSPVLLMSLVTVVVPVPQLSCDFQMMSVGGLWRAPSTLEPHTCGKNQQCPPQN